MYKLLFVIIWVVVLLFVNNNNLMAQSCDVNSDLPLQSSYNNCQYEDINYNLFMNNQATLELRNNSNIKVKGIYFASSNFLIDLQDSTLSVDYLRPQSSDYEVNIKLNNSTMEFRNNTEANINNMDFTEGNSTLQVGGITDFSINSITTCDTCISNVIVEDSSVTLAIKSGNITNLYTLGGKVVLDGGYIEGNTFTIDNISNIDPNHPPVDPETPEPVEDTIYGYLEVTGDANVIVKHSIKLDTLFLYEGTFTVEGDYDIAYLYDTPAPPSDNIRSSSVGSLVIKSTAVGSVGRIDLTHLTIEGSGSLSVTHYGEIVNINSDLQVPSGTLIFEGIPMEMTPEEDGTIPESPPSILTLTNVKLDNLIINGGEVVIKKSGTINNVEGCLTEECNDFVGSLSLEYATADTGGGVVSNNVSIANLSLFSSDYTITGELKANNIELAQSSTLTLSQDELNVEKLYLNNSEILSQQEDGIIINITGTQDVSPNNNVTDDTDKYELYIYDSLLKVNDISVSGDIYINVDDNILDDCSDSGCTVNDGIDASGEIDISGSSVTIGIADTTMFNLDTTHSYYVMHSNTNNGIISNDSTNYYINLPEWFAVSDVYIKDDANGGENLQVDIERVKTYEQLVAESKYKEDNNTLEIAKALDKMIDNQEFTQGMVETISGVDLNSDINTIAGNLSTLQPINATVFINDINSTANTILDMIENNSITNDGRNEDRLWVKNALKSGTTNQQGFVVGNEYKGFIVQAGGNLYKTRFQSGEELNINVSGGINVSNINADYNLYQIDSAGFNGAFDIHYNSKYYDVAFTTAYIVSNYSNTRYNFLNDAMTSNSNVSDIFNNLTISSKSLTVLKDNSFLRKAGLMGIGLKPKVFYSNSYIFSSGYDELGLEALHQDSYSNMIQDIGVGLTLQGNTVQRNNVYIVPYLDFKAFQRNYTSPNTVVGFSGMSDEYNMNMIGEDLSSLVLRTAVGVEYSKNNSTLGLKYAIEKSYSNYTEQLFFINYKFNLN